MAAKPPVVRFNDVTESYREQRTEIDVAVAAVLERGDFIGGRAIAENAAGGGAIVRLELPASDLPPRPERVPAAEPDQAIR